MQIKLLPAVLLFLGSYLPLALILAVQDIEKDYWSRPLCGSLHFWNDCELPGLGSPKLAYFFIIVSALSLIFFVWVLKHLRGSTEMRIEECKTIPNDLINYVFPYIVSFMGVELGDTGKVLLIRNDPQPSGWRAGAWDGSALHRR